MASYRRTIEEPDVLDELGIHDDRPPLNEDDHLPEIRTSEEIVMDSNGGKNTNGSVMSHGMTDHTTHRPEDPEDLC